MTTRQATVVIGESLESQAIDHALMVSDPNRRSPAFALHEIFKAANKSGAVKNRWDMRTRIGKELEVAYRDCVSWNDMKSEWQLGQGTHVAFEKIVQIAVKWYVNDWDFKRHTRDSDVQYPEDLDLVQGSSEFKHMSGVLMPSKDELTRRLIHTKNSDLVYYLDVVPDEDGRFVASIGHFDDHYRSNRRCGPPDTFWNLEMKTVFPILAGARVLSYKIHHICAKREV
jgi:hypothetical protein